MTIGGVRAYETADEIIDSCRGIASFTKVRLAKWHRAGLIERPVTVKLGRGKGSESRYPIGTSEIVAAIVRKPKRMKTADRAWDLWWEGHQIPPRTIRRALSRLANDWDTCLTVCNLEEELTKLETQRLPPRVAQMSKRVGRENLRAVAKSVLSAVTDRVDASAVDQVDASRYDKAFNLKRARTDKLSMAGPLIQSDQNEIIRIMQSVFRGRSMAATLSELTDEQVRQSRDQYRAIIGVLDHAIRQNTAIFGKGAFGFEALGALANPKDRQGQQFITIAWPLIVAHSQLKDGADIFLSNEETLRKTDIVIREVEVLRKNIPDIACVANIRRLGAALKNKKKQAQLNADARRLGRKYRPKIAAVLKKHRASEAHRKKIRP